MDEIIEARGPAPAGPLVRQPFWVPLLSPKPGAPVSVTLTGGPLVGCWQHWIPDPDDERRGRTWPCRRDRAKCPTCLGGHGRRWKGWLPAWLHLRGRHVLAELTRDAARAIGDELGRHGANVRGWTLTLRRRGPAGNAPVAAELTPRAPHPDLPDGPVDVRLACCRLWGLELEWAGLALAWTDGPPDDWE